MQKILTLLLIGFFIGGCVNTATHDGQIPVAHVVMIWLKDPGNLQDRQRVIDASKRLAAIHGVTRVKVGEPILSDRDVVDDSFDVGLYVELDSQQSLRSYATDKAHLKLLREELAPVTARYVVYDFVAGL